MAYYKRIYRYDNKYFCKYCHKFYDRSLIFLEKWCGVCKNKEERIRTKPRRHKSDLTRKHYNEKYY